LIRPLARHRVVSLIPLLLLALATVVGGWVNGVEMRGRVVDELTNEPVGTAGPARITHGARTVIADAATGNFTFPDLPRQSTVAVDAPGYLRKGVAPTEQEIRMSPLSFTLYVNESGNPDKHIESAEVRLGDKLLGTTNPSGNMVISPYPGVDAKLLICKEGYDQKEITVRGVLMTIEITPGTNTCPPLPTPTPSPSPSPAPSDSTPSASPTPSPTASP
jgi:hypothetical protein